MAQIGRSGTGVLPLCITVLPRVIRLVQGMKRIHSGKKQMGLDFCPKNTGIAGIADVGLGILVSFLKKVSFGRSGTRHFSLVLPKKVSQNVSQSHIYQT